MKRRAISLLVLGFIGFFSGPVFTMSTNNSSYLIISFIGMICLIIHGIINRDLEEQRTARNYAKAMSQTIQQNSNSNYSNFCSSCGSSVSNDAAYCFKCGSKL
jgi:K+-sensing histidine kinase KdpD